MCYMVLHPPLRLASLIIAEDLAKKKKTSQKGLGFFPEP